MAFIILIIALVALVLAIGAYKGRFFEARFQIYEDLVTIFSQLLALKFSAAQLHKLDYLILRAKFLYNYDLAVLSILNKTRDYMADSLESHHAEAKHPKETQKTQEMIRWIEQITSKHYSEDEKSELDKIFERYLKVSLIIEIPPMVTELFHKITDFLRQLLGKLKP